MIDELRSPEMLEKIGQLRSEGKSWTYIKSEIEKLINKKVDITSIQRAYKAMSVRSSEIIAKDEELKGRLTQIVFNQKEQLEKINSICNNLLDNLLEKGGSTAAVLATMREIREQIKLQKELLDRMSEGFDPKNVSAVHYTNISVNNLKELEKSGFIRILKKPGAITATDLDVINLSRDHIRTLLKSGQIRVKNYLIQTKARWQEMVSQ